MGKTESSSDLREQLNDILEKLRQYGYQIDELLLDGEFHDFKLDATAEKKSGSYCATQTVFGYTIHVTNFKEPSQNCSFEVKGSELTAEEKAALQKQIEDDKSKRERKKRMLQETVANEAWARFNLAVEDPQHPYLLRKGLKGAYGTRAYLGSLMIPMRDIEGKFWGFESISANPENKVKAKLKGARLLGCLHLIGEIDPEKTLYLAEGFATAATIFETTGLPSVCTFSTTNLKAVALALRVKYPNLKMIIAGDWDAAGRKAAKVAAHAADAFYQIPEVRSPHPENKDFNDLRTYEGEGTVRMQLQDETRALKPTNDKRAYIDQWLEKRDLIVGYTGTISYGDEEWDLDTIKNSIYLDSLDDHISLPDRLLEGHMKNWLIIKKREQFEVLRSRIMVHSPNTELQRLVTALIKTPTENDLLVFRHFIWQVKRKLVKLPVEHHMMPVIAGKHRSGKTETIRKLLLPLDRLAIEGNFGSFEDKREFFEFNRRYAMFFDEMEKAEKADIHSIKRKITEKEINYRVLGTHSTEEKRMNCTFIATTNDTLKNLIKDPFSMRRFYEMTSLDKADFETINSIDYLKIWQSVSELEPCPIARAIDSIDAHQDKSRHLTDIEYWTRECGMEKSERSLSITQLYKNYCQYATDTGSTPSSRKYLSESLERLGFKKFRASSGVQFYVQITRPS